MDRTNGVGPSGRRIARRLLAGLVATAAAGVLALAALSVVPSRPSGAAATRAAAQPEAAPQATAVAPAWGSEVLRAAGERAFAWAPVSVANACGIGASSCFKCHNGTRAMAPKEDPKTAPWHPDHKVVTDDCVGCHGGNPRIIKKEIAHNKLVAKPLTAEACERCHKSGNAPALLKKYQLAAAGKLP